MPTIEEWLVGQHLAYHFLSKVFYEPPVEDFIITLVTNQLFEDWPLEPEQTAGEVGLARLRGFCQNWNQTSFAQLKQEYARLFIDPEHIPVPLWESVYRNPEHLLFQEETLQVRRQYQRFGMRTPHLNSEPDDHLGLELQFIAYLSRLGLAAIEQEQPEKLDVILAGMRDFLTDHLLLWVGGCLHNLLEATDHPFYTGAAYLTLGCLTDTHQSLQLEAAHESGQVRFSD